MALSEFGRKRCERIVGAFVATRKLESAEYAGGYRIRLRFADGRVGEIHLASGLWGEVDA